MNIIHSTTAGRIDRRTVFEYEILKDVEKPLPCLGNLKLLRLVKKLQQSTLVKLDKILKIE